MDLRRAGLWVVVAACTCIATVVRQLPKRRGSTQLRCDCKRAAAADAVRRADEVHLRSTRRSVTVWLIRHAQSLFNASKGDINNGRHLDVELSELGRRQACALGERIGRCGEHFERVFASTALRAQDTASIALAAAGQAGVAVEIVEGIEEVAMGGWTGKRKAVCNTPLALAAREADAWEWRPPHTCPETGLGGESYRDVEQRMVDFIERFVLPASESRAPEGTREGATGVSPVVAVFTHHCAIRCVLRPLLEAAPLVLAPKLSPRNTSITELHYNAAAKGRKGGWSVVRVNDAAHLEGL